MMIDHEVTYFESPKDNPDWGKFKPFSQVPFYREFTGVNKLDNEYLFEWITRNCVELRRCARREGLENLPWTENFNVIYEAARKHSSPSVVVFGSGAYKSIGSQIQMQTGLAWYGHLTGVYRRKGEDVNDIDIFVHSNTEAELTAKGFKFEESRSDKNLAIATVPQLLDNGKVINLQVHLLRNSNDNPLIVHMNLAPTKVMATCLVYRKEGFYRNFYIVDPYDALSRGPWDQQFPSYLFDTVIKNTTSESRAINNALIWALSTPFFPDDFNELKGIRTIITNSLDTLSESQIDSLADRYLKMDWRTAYSDELFVESTCYSVLKLAKLGFLPKLLEIPKLKEHLLISIGCFILMQKELNTKLSKHLPTISWDDIDYYNIDNLEKASQQLDWNQITKSPLPKPY